MVEKLIIANNIDEVASYMKNGMVPLSGGTEINRLHSGVKAINFVCINKIPELCGIEKTTLEGKDCAYVKIGANTTFQEAIDSAFVPSYLKEALHFMSSRIRRNMATLAGNIAIRRDDSYLISVLLATDAKVELVSEAGLKSVVSVSEYVFKGEKYYQNLVTAIYVKENVSGVAQKRYANTASSHGYITMAVAKKGDRYQVGLCVKNSGIYVFDGSQNPEVLLKDDIFGSVEYKNYLIKITKEDLISKVEALAGGAK